MGKTHGRITAYIHLDAVEANFEQMKKNIPQDTCLIAVVKTDGYGHGAVPIARKIEKKDYIWGFAVAAVEEARLLRDGGIRKPILILGYTFAEDYRWMAENEVRPVLFTGKMAEDFQKAAEGLPAPVPFHTAIDTGMSRIGFADTQESLQELTRIAGLSGITLEGIFTHFARADELDKTSTRRQYERFTAFCDALKEKLGPEKPLLCHCGNSAAILELPWMHLDMMRAGISIYGIYPSDEVNRQSVSLTPVMELKSQIVHIKDIPADTAISYGGTFTAKEPMTIATVPVGYGDGYPRALSNCGEVLIRGKRAPIVGRICMDQFMVDLTGIPAQVLEEVTLLGRDGEEEITADELGRLSGRFPYELICDIGKRVPRVYLDE